MSCSSHDDKNESSLESKIIGKWQITEVTNLNDYEPCDGETSKSTWKLEGNQLTFLSEILPIPFVVEIVLVDDSRMVVKFSAYGKIITDTYKRL